MRLLDKLFEVGFVNFSIGCIKRIQYTILCKRYGFDKWHIQPYELRKYIIETGKYISRYKPLLVVDIGCGLGDLLRHIKLSESGQGFGYDLDGGAVKVAKRLTRSKKLNFQVGTFDQVDFSQKIDYLCALGFMHGASEEIWKLQFENVIRRNRIHHIVVDVFPEDKSKGWHRLDFSKILPPSFVEERRLGPFKEDKYIEVWQNCEVEN